MNVNACAKVGKGRRDCGLKGVAIGLRVRRWRWRPTMEEMFPMAFSPSHWLVGGMQLARIISYSLPSPSRTTDGLSEWVMRIPLKSTRSSILYYNLLPANHLFNKGFFFPFSIFYSIKKWMDFEYNEMRMMKQVAVFRSRLTLGENGLNNIVIYYLLSSVWQISIIVANDT